MPIALGTVAAHHYQAPPVNPFSLAVWHSAYWASDSLWTPPADGAAVTAWRDGSGNNRTMTATHGPPYRAAYAQLNNRPAVEFDGVEDYAQTTPFGAVANQSLVSVFRAAQIGGDRYTAAGGDNAAAGGTSGSQWHMHAGTSVKGGVPDTSRHLVIFEFAGDASQIIVDGVQVLTGNPGTATSTRWTIASWPQSMGVGPGANAYGFIGFKAGALTAQEKADLLAWSRTFYATP